MHELVPILSRDAISRLVSQTARKISTDYQDKDLVLVGVLKGAFHFVSDLSRQLTIPVQIDFVRAASYGDGTCSSGCIRLTKELEIDIAEKDVLIVEDIVDTGLTLSYLIDYLKTFSPRSVKVCALLDKHERRQTTVTVDYACHHVAEGFLVGYGLDYGEFYRNLPEIFDLKL